MFFKKNKTQENSLDLAETSAVEGHCFISGNVRIMGEVQFAGTLRIDGRVDGKVSNYPGKHGTLILSKGAFINGPVETTNLIADGSVQGEVHVNDRLECRPNAVLKGEVHYGAIQIHEGARIMGRCHQRSREPHLKEVGGHSSTATTQSLATRDMQILRKTNV